MNIKSMKLMLCCVAGLAVMGSCGGPRNEQKEGLEGGVRVKTGVEVLRQNQFDVLQGKRVGLVTNPTGVDAMLRSTVDILSEAEGVQLTALYGPEHGVRGNVTAGGLVDNAVDEKTGLAVYSLYGRTRKPTADMLQDVDVLVYDIQDIGSRSYTFISTMMLVMQAAAEQDKEVVVLDRPNPLGGLKVEGRGVDSAFVSFVSQADIPYIYGLTCGELATMLNEEGMIGTDSLGQPLKCRLTVVPMEGWRRSMTWEQTGLPWVLTSPGVPHWQTSLFYPATGILGELYYVSIGVGYTLPFELVAAPWVNGDSLAQALNELNLPGLRFRPISFTPYYGSLKGEALQGVQVFLTDYEAARLTEVQFHVMEAMNRLWPGHEFFSEQTRGRFGMFDKVCGTDSVRLRFGERYRFDDIRDLWRSGEEEFKMRSSKYYLYE